MTDLLARRCAALDPPDLSWPRSIVCGVDGSGESREAVRQAAALTSPCGDLELHLVTRGQADPALVLAEATAWAPADAQVRATSAASAAAGLVRAAQGADLLVVGCDALGPTPTAVLRRAPCSVLLARRPPDLALFDVLLVADEDEPDVHELAAQLAHAHGGEVRTVPRNRLPVVAAAIGCGLMVIGDGPAASALARVAPCSVLVLRER